MNFNDNQQNLINKVYQDAKKYFDAGFKGNYYNEFLIAYQIRKIEKKLLELFSKSILSGTIHTCIGQELIGVAVSKFLESNDWVTSNHRCHGHFISKTGYWKQLIDELLGLDTGVSRGIGSSQHLYSHGFISNGTQGSLLPVASGIAYSMKTEDKSNVALSFIGEGTLGEGVLYETLNLSSKLSLPHIFICENNFYSQSTPQAKSLSGSIEKRAKAFGIDYSETSIWNLDDLFNKCQNAIKISRNRKKPFFLNIMTYRLAAHSKGDDDRDINEINLFQDIDPLKRFIDEHPSEIAKIGEDIDQYVESRLYKTKYFNYDEYIQDQLPKFDDSHQKEIINPKKIMIQSLRESYFDKLVNDDAFFVGEDIGDPYGGAFKIHKGFETERPKQIVSTPISEAALVGFSIGLSMQNKVAIAEIMFGDFIVNAMDQIINNASKFFHMYGKQFSCPVIIRTPMGGKRGYGPTHSQSLEKFLVGIDNLVVSATTSLLDPKYLISNLVSLKSPKILIENKIDYTKILYQPLSGLSLNLLGENLSSVYLSPIGTTPTVCIICYGGIAREIADSYVEIFEKSDCAFSLFCPQIIHPFPMNHIESLKDLPSRFIVLDEGTSNFSWSDGIASKLYQLIQNITVRVLNADPVPIPSNRTLEQRNLISIEKIIENIKLIEEEND